jgi:hypothetical protein
MEKMKITDYHYYPDSDELDLVINVDKPQPAISVYVDDDFYLRVNPDTQQVVGAAIFNASELADLARAFALKELDDSNVRFFFERKVESLAPEHA